jgi:prepilin-type N-terminal cleavage/methylation domain-containing protein
MLNHKLKAFTIMEVTIALLVSGILIAIVYVAFAVVNNSYHAFVLKNVESADLAQLDLLLSRDFRRADLIEKTDSGLFFKNNNGGIRYVLNSDYIVRTNGITDTFKFKTTRTNMLFEQQPVETGPDALNSRVDELELDLLLHNDKMTFHYYKQYSSANLFEQDTHAGN